MAEKEEKARSLISRRKLITNIKIYGTTAVVGALTYFLYQRVPAPTPALDTVVDRLVFTLRCQLPSFFLVFLFILDVALVRLSTRAFDPINGNSEDLVKTKNRILANTVEQILINVPAQLVLSTYLDADSIKIMPILAGWFFLGRILFKLGYPLQRTYGVAMTMNPTTLTFLFCFYNMYTRGMTCCLGGK